MLAIVLAAASMRARPMRMSLPEVGGRIRFGDEELMAPKGHGTTARAVQESLLGLEIDVSTSGSVLL